MNMPGTGSPSISEILDAAFKKAQAVIVLLTGDDEVRLREEFRDTEDKDFEAVLTPQARPNVLFEAGMALGRYPDQTILVRISSNAHRYIVMSEVEEG